MILTTTETIAGRELETLGLVKGSTIQTVNMVRDLGAGLKTLVGGELTKYNEPLSVYGQGCFVQRREAVQTRSVRSAMTSSRAVRTSRKTG